MQKISFLLLAFGLVISTAQAQWSRIKGSGNITKQQRSVPAFTGVTVSGSMKAIVKQGSNASVEIETDDNLMEYITTEVKNGQLVIGYKPKVNINSSKGTTIYITNPVLDRASISGSGSIRAEEPMKSSGKFSANISGSGSVYVNVGTQQAQANISGSGNIELIGSCESLNVSIAGSGNFKGYEFSSRSSTIKISGSGNVQTLVNGKLDANIAGSGSVLYKGEGAISVKTAGSGRVRKVDN